jgi:hypothetical protein
VNENTSEDLLYDRFIVDITLLRVLVLAVSEDWKDKRPRADDQSGLLHLIDPCDAQIVFHVRENIFLLLFYHIRYSSTLIASDCECRELASH